MAPSRLPSVDVDSYNIELKDEDGFLGDRASKGAFQDILEDWRKPLRKASDDPFGEDAVEEISKKELDEILVGDDVAAAALVHGAVEEFAQQLAYVTRPLSQDQGLGQAPKRSWSAAASARAASANWRSRAPSIILKARRPQGRPGADPLSSG